MKKFCILLIALVMTGMTAVAPVLEAQTAAQQKELEDIARRSVNGLSAKDRQRVVQIMTDLMVKEGVPRDQARALAEQNADTMFDADPSGYEPTAEQKRQLEEAQKAADAYDEFMKNGGIDSLTRQQQPVVTGPGENAGWPPAAAFTSFYKLPVFKQPAGTTARYDGEASSYDGKWHNVRVYLSGGDKSKVTADLVKQVEKATKKKMTAIDNDNWIISWTVGKGRDSHDCSLSVYVEDGVVEFGINESVQ